MEVRGFLASQLPPPPVAPYVAVHIVVPGEVICEAQGFMRGHGTYLQGEHLVASLAGVVERVNKFITVRPLRSRYTGDVGDVVVGRVTSVQQKRWKVDVQAKQEAALLLSSINLPGDVRRRRTVQDQLQMRSFFEENDLISAEVQQFFQDGSISLHTRHKYGKLTNGMLVQVPPTLIKRSKAHLRAMNIGVDLIIGTNGEIWVTPLTHARTEFDEDEMEIDEPTPSVQMPVTPELRLTMSRVRNAIVVLARTGRAIDAEAIGRVYKISLDNRIEPKRMLDPDVLPTLSADL